MRRALIRIKLKCVSMETTQCGEHCDRHGMARPRYFTPAEVSAHNAPSDCWVSFLGKVYDLTPLCKENAGV